MLLRANDRFRKLNLSTNFDMENSTIESRLKSERERLKLSQAAICSRLLVSKGTYIKYESGETSPTARHLAVLDDMGFDIYYVVVGERTGNELGAEFGNLIAAYADASEDLKAAALAVLMARYNRDVGAAQVVPRYFEEEVRPRGATSLTNSGGTIGQVVQGDAHGGGQVIVNPPDDSKKRK